MKQIILLSQRIPFPPNKGEKIRTFSILRHLAKTHDVYAGCFIDDTNDLQYINELQKYCADICCIPINKRWKKLASLTGLLNGQSLSEVYFRDEQLARWVMDILAKHQPEAAMLFCSVMAQYIPNTGPLRPSRVVMDFIDVDSEKWRQYATSTSVPMRWIYEREADRLATLERAIIRNTDDSVLVSTAEAKLMRQLTPDHAGNIHGIANGIDHAFFTPDPTLPRPFAKDERAIVFTGTMDYWPNVDAVTWFAAKIFPRIRASMGNASFVIVGANPSAEVRTLAQQPGITVTGRVPDVRPFLTHADAVVAPLRIARGIQNKVLEGMAMERVVIATPQAAEGIEATAGRHLLVAGEPQAFTEAVLRALTDPNLASMGAAARSHVIATYDWGDKLAGFDRLLAPR